MILLFKARVNMIFRLFILLTIGLIASCSNTVTQSEMKADDQGFSGKEGTIVLNNSGSNAYIVTDIKGEGASSELNESNSEITLTLGGRYTFKNESGASNHPLDFRNSRGDKLLGQSNDEGSFSEDNAVNIQREGDSITFTLTESLAEEIVDYICSFHPTMNGSVNVIE